MFTRENLRELQKRKTRRRILDCAYELFEKRSYEKTAMRDLAEHAGVALGTIFKFFLDKSGLMVAAFADDIGDLVERASATLPTSGVREQLLHLTR